MNFKYDSFSCLEIWPKVVEYPSFRFERKDEYLLPGRFSQLHASEIADRAIGMGMKTIG